MLNQKIMPNSKPTKTTATKKTVVKKTTPTKTTGTRTRKASPKTYVQETVAPVIEKDYRSLLGLPNWVLYVVVIVVGLLLVNFIYQGCNRKKVEANSEKVIQLQQQLEKSESQNAKLKDNLETLSNAIDSLYDYSQQATADRIAGEIEGQTRRDKIKNITNEIKSKISNPATTDAERDALEQQLLRARQAAKMSLNQ